MKIKLKRFHEHQKLYRYFVEEVINPVFVVENEYLTEDAVKNLIEFSLEIVNENDEPICRLQRNPT